MPIKIQDAFRCKVSCHIFLVHQSLRFARFSLWHAINWMKAQSSSTVPIFCSRRLPMEAFSMYHNWGIVQFALRRHLDISADHVPLRPTCIPQLKSREVEVREGTLCLCAVPTVDECTMAYWIRAFAHKMFLFFIFFTEFFWPVENSKFHLFWCVETVDTVFYDTHVTTSA